MSLHINMLARLVESNSILKLFLFSGSSENSYICPKAGEVSGNVFPSISSFQHFISERHSLEQHIQRVYFTEQTGV